MKSCLLVVLEKLACQTRVCQGVATGVTRIQRGPVHFAIKVVMVLILKGKQIMRRIQEAVMIIIHQGHFETSMSLLIGLKAGIMTGFAGIPDLDPVGICGGNHSINTSLLSQVMDEVKWEVNQISKELRQKARFTLQLRVIQCHPMHGLCKMCGHRVSLMDLSLSCLYNLQYTPKLRCSSTLHLILSNTGKCRIP